MITFEKTGLKPPKRSACAAVNLKCFCSFLNRFLNPSFSPSWVHTLFAPHFYSSFFDVFLLSRIAPSHGLVHIPCTVSQLISFCWENRVPKDPNPHPILLSVPSLIPSLFPPFLSLSLSVSVSLSLSLFLDLSLFLCAVKWVIS